MDTTPKLMPLSELGQRQTEIPAALNESPLVLTEGNRAAVIVADADYWNQIVQELRDLRETLDMPFSRPRRSPAPTCNS